MSIIENAIERVSASLKTRVPSTEFRVSHSVLGTFLSALFSLTLPKRRDDKSLLSGKQPSGFHESLLMCWGSGRYGRRYGRDLEAELEHIYRSSGRCHVASSSGNGPSGKDTNAPFTVLSQRLLAVRAGEKSLALQLGCSGFWATFDSPASPPALRVPQSPPSQDTSSASRPVHRYTALATPLSALPWLCSSPNLTTTCVETHPATHSG